nr:MAG TPA_asm: hypothetical protein [Caudoviricetes sp.]
MIYTFLFVFGCRLNCSTKNPIKFIDFGLLFE